MRKRIVSLLLSLALCLTLLPTAAFAEEAQQEELLPGEQLEQVQPVQEEPEENEEQSQQDEDVIAVQALINALPDASALGEMDAEALKSACLAASEAYEAYDALTEEQQSTLTGVENMIAILEWATRQVELLAEDGDVSKHTDHSGWAAINSEEGLKNLTGKGYLTDNVTLTSTWAPPSGVVLCLNGKTITGADGQEAIQVNRGVTFTLTDCHTGNEVGQITHKTDASGCGVYVQYGTFNMYGGSITGNTVGGSGGGVCATNSTFNMYGGSITGNSAKSQGGGVYAASTFNMYGGTISDNSASQGGGVFVSTQHFTVSGNAKITDNTDNVGSEKNNVYLNYSGTSIQIGTEGLQSGAKIGVTTYATPSNSAPVTIVSSDAKAGYEEYFTSDKEGCYPVYQGGKIVLYAGAPHKHPICGETCADGEHTQNITWTPIETEGELKAASANGNYYLTGDVTLTENEAWKPADGVVLCLNGHTITTTANVDAIKVGQNVTFTLTNCKDTGKITHQYRDQDNHVRTATGCGAYVNGGTFHLYGGTFSKNIGHNIGRITNGGGVYVESGTFYMYGGSITGNIAGSINDNTYGGGVYLSDGGTFHMSGGSIIGNSSGKCGGGVYVENNSTFTLSGSASITGNWTNGSGGGVYVRDSGSKFEMHDNASITGNKADTGGGVHVGWNGTFHMSGGSITGNNVKNNGGGVNLASGSFTVSGSASITGNVKGGSESNGIYTGGTANNVGLKSDSSITIGDGLTGTARIGVSLDNNYPSSGNRTQIATNATGNVDYTKIFTPDVTGKGYEITKDDSGNLYLSAHQHRWTYAQGSTTDTITATCKDCPLAIGGYSGSITINAPVDTLTYDGRAKKAEVTKTQWSGDVSISYKVKTGDSENDWGALPENTAAPTNAGTYTASIKLTGADGQTATASVKYTIQPATITVTPMNGQSKQYGETDPELTYTTSIDSDTTLAPLFNTAKTGKLSRATGDNVGSYAITLGDLTAGSNFNLTLGSTVNFTITAADYSYVVAAAQDFRAGSGLSAITAPANGSGVKGETVDGTLTWYSDSGRTTEAADTDLSNVPADSTVTLYWRFTATNSNYTNTHKEGVTVFTAKDKQTLTITGVEMDASSYTYGDTVGYNNSNLSVTGATDFNNDDLEYIYSGTPTDGTGFTTGDTAPTKAGSYQLTVKVPDSNADYMGQQVINFTIEQKSISGMTVTLDKTEFEYNGRSQSVTASVAGLTAGTDYTVTGNTGTTVASYTVTVTGTGNYKDNATATWEITQATPDVGTVSYTGGTIYTSTALSAISLNKDGTATGTLALNADQTLTAGMQEYNWTFTPGDTTNYKTVTGTVSLTVTEDALVSIAVKTGTAPTKVNYKYKEPFEISGAVIEATYKSGATKDVTSEVEFSTTLAVNQTKVEVTYQGQKCEITGITVNKADALTSLADITVSQKYTVTTEQSKDIGNAGMPEDAGTLSYAKGSESTTGSATIVFAVDGSTVKFTITGGANGEVITLPVTITSDNYADSIVNVKITLTDKDIPTVSANGITVTYDGKAIPASKITGTASVAGTWEWKFGMKVTNVDDSGEKTVVFKPTDSANYVEVEKNIKVTINKATPTGEPTYTKITTSGKKLSDAAIAIGSITPTGGTIAWDLPGTTDVTANTAYGWTFTPTNPNYNNLTGKIKPYVVSSSGGGGGSGSSSSKPTTHPVKAEVSKDPDGSVSLSKTSAAKGDKVTITVKPERHYEVDEVIVRDSKGKQLAVKDNGDGTFTFEMPADKVTVEPTFSWVNPFADVANNAYYVDAVEWMLKREVTQGTTEATFGPDLNCTRAQIVTFLWRVAGSPEAKGMVSFADVSAGSYYAKAVAWAVENGITGGTGDGLFSPDAACTRAQSAAFLYRAAGSPAVNGSAGFSDVAADAYYAQAVAWAKEHGITDGIGGGLFGSANDCTRAQIVTFLYRAYQGK